MAKYKMNPVILEAITFDEFLDFGRKVSKTIDENGMPRSFNIKNVQVLHHTNECYYIPTRRGLEEFTPNHMLILGEKEGVQTYLKEDFLNNYHLLEENGNDTGTKG